MIEKVYKINDEIGIHARPAAELVQLVKNYKSEISIYKDGKKASGRSLLQIMGLGAKKGDEISVEFSGEDEEKLEEEFSKFAAEKF